MKKLTAIMLLLILPLLMTAQEAAKKRTYLDVSVGISIPVGQYSKTDNNTYESRSGYAKTGMYLSVAAAFMGKSSLGLGAKYLYQNNNFQDAAQDIKIHGTIDSLGSEGWSNHYIMGGLFFIKDANKLLLDGQVLAGLILSFSPVFSVQSPYNRSTESGNGVGFGLGINAGIGFRVAPKVIFKFSAGFLSGFPVYNKEYPSQLIGYDTINSIPIYSAPVEKEIKKTVTSVNLGVGLIFKL